jgi:hypothetical protein
MTKKKGAVKNDNNVEKSIDGVDRDASSSSSIQGLTPAADKYKRFSMCIQANMMK